MKELSKGVLGVADYESAIRFGLCDMCNPSHMYSVTKHDTKIIFGTFGPAQLINFYFLAPVKVRQIYF